MSHRCAAHAESSIDPSFELAGRVSSVVARRVEDRVLARDGRRRRLMIVRVDGSGIRSLASAGRYQRGRHEVAHRPREA
jgi:hypothetical protein